MFQLSNGKRVRGKSLGINFGIDSGLAKITDEGEYPWVPMGKSGDLRRGAWILAIGHPGGYQRDRPAVVRIGRVIFSNESVIRTDGTLVGGDSGGPLFNLSGQVVGIHSRIGRSLTANLHVPVDAYVSDWKRLVAGEAWGQMMGQSGGPFVGIGGADHPKGVRITSVVEGHAAAKAGIRVDDVVTRFDGRKVRNYRSMIAMIHTKKPGDTVKVVIERGGTTIEKTLKLGKRPQRF